MKKNIIKQRGSALKERKLNTKAAESFTINYTLKEALDEVMNSVRKPLHYQ